MSTFPSQAGMFTDLTVRKPCAGNHNLCENRSATVLPCLEDLGFFQSFLTYDCQCPLPGIVPESWQGTYDIDVSFVVALCGCVFHFSDEISEIH